MAEEPDEIAKLFWERARVLRAAGDREGALAALENVRLLEPDHVGALALSGEIYITLGRFAEAAENLARLGALEDAPAQQRLMSGIAAVDLNENKLDDAYAALDVLANLHRARLSTLAAARTARPRRGPRRVLGAGHRSLGAADERARQLGRQSGSGTASDGHPPRPFARHSPRRSLHHAPAQRGTG